MRLAKLSEFRQTFYTPTSAPALSTLRANIEKIPGGRKVGGRYYIDLDEYDRATHLSETLEARRKQLKNSSALEGLI